MDASPRVLLVGAGNMGMALLKGWLACGRSPHDIAVVDALASARDAVAELAVRAGDTVEPELVERADIVVLAVKPQQLDTALRSMHAAKGSAVFLSIAAGKRIATLRDGLGGAAAVVRAMPNTPAAIGRGMSVLCAGPGVSEVQRALCAELLGAVGAVAWVDCEAALDGVTAVSGSGPAYVFLLIEALTRAAMEVGLETDLARRLALETVAGSGEYAKRAGADAAELRRRVTSPGGTTEAALEILMAAPGGLPDLIVQAVRTAAERSRALD